MSFLETINKILHYGDHKQIAYSVILGAIVGGLAIGIGKSSFKGDYSNIIELIIGGGILLNLPFNPITHGIGFVLAVDGFSSIVDQVFKEEECEDCIPFRCFKIKYTITDPLVRGDLPSTEVVPQYPPGCEKYFNRLRKYLNQDRVERGVVIDRPVIESPNNFKDKDTTSSEPSQSVSEQATVSDKDVSETSE